MKGPDTISRRLQSTEHTWTIVTDEGLAMFAAVFTEDEARLYVEKHPMTANGTPQYAVPQELAGELGEMWRAAQKESEQVLRQARRRRTRAALAAAGEPIASRKAPDVQLPSAPLGTTVREWVDGPRGSELVTDEPRPDRAPWPSDEPPAEQLAPADRDEFGTGLGELQAVDES